MALTTGAYTLLYMTVPNRDVDWRDAAWGGLVAALAFEIAKRVFAIFIRQFPTYAIIYGALAALPLFLLWMYLSWMITLVGALLTAALPVVKYERWWYEPVPGGAFVDAVAVLKVLHGSARLTGTALVAQRQIRAHTRIGYDEMTGCSTGWWRPAGSAACSRTRARGARGAGTRARGHGCLGAAGRPGAAAPGRRLPPVRVRRLRSGGRARRRQRGRGGERRPLASPLALDTEALARQVEAAVEGGLDADAGRALRPGPAMTPACGPSPRPGAICSTAAERRSRRRGNGGKR